MSTAARRKNCARGEKQGHRAERGRRPSRLRRIIRDKIARREP